MISVSKSIKLAKRAAQALKDVEAALKHDDFKSAAAFISTARTLIETLEYQNTRRMQRIKRLKSSNPTELG